MDFKFFRGYSFGKEKDAKKFFDNIDDIKVKNIENRDGKTRVVLLATESAHVEIDSFIWENIDSWKSFLGSVDCKVK